MSLVTQAYSNLQNSKRLSLISIIYGHPELTSDEMTLLSISDYALSKEILFQIRALTGRLDVASMLAERSSVEELEKTKGHYKPA